jgi:antitoxin component YwqK of YwqJK toxin-antitoxin module
MSMAAACVACGAELSASRCTHCGAAGVVRDYRVVRVLSEQPHSRVYLATAADGSSVVLKELAFSLVPNAQTLEAFQREADLLRQLSHPQLPSFLDAFQEGTGVETRLYLAMSYVEGRSLLEEVEAHRFNEAEVLDIAAQGLELLVYLHGLSPPVIHRDVKPANLLRRPDGTVALVDFGAAREVQRATSGHATLVGTLGYMPPEQMVGVTTPGSDVYALGATLVHLLSRTPPTELLGEDMRLEFRKKVNLRPPTLRFLERLVHRDPRKRFATAARALAELEAIRSGRASRRRSLLLVGGGVGVVGTLAVGALVLPPLVQEMFAPAASEVKAEATAQQPAADPRVGTPLDISCGAGAYVVEDTRKRSRWCSQMSETGHPVRQGAFVRWGNDMGVVERSSYANDKLHGKQVTFYEGRKLSEGEWREGKKVGLWVVHSTFSGNSKEREETYKDGVLEGPARTFDSDGSLKEEGTYQDGKKQGVWSIHERGGKTSETTFDQGKQHGPYISWHHHDDLVNEQGAYANGEKTGVWVQYHSNKQKLSEGSFERGRQEGEWRTWHSSNGQLASQGAYARGEKTGPWVTWFSNGQKESEGSYEKGQEVGTWAKWYETGVKRSEVIRQPDGMTRSTTWYANGKLETQSQHKGHSREGTQTTWYDNGKKKSLTAYKNGQQEGLATTWHDNGRKSSEGRYVAGRQTGTWRWWQSDGKVQRVENFEKR